MRRPAVFLALALFVGVLIWLIGRNPPDLEMVRTEVGALGDWYEDRPAMVSLLFFLAYVAVTALSLPLAVWMTLAAGALFGLSAIGYRAATLALPAGDTLERAAVTLAAVTCFQTLAMLPWLRWRDPGEVTRVLARWRITALVGVTGMLGSLGWFVAFALQNAAYVRAVGQVELVFSALVSWLVFRERASGRELAGIGLLGVSIVLLVLLAA